MALFWSTDNVFHKAFPAQYYLSPTSISNLLFTSLHPLSGYQCQFPCCYPSLPVSSLWSCSIIFFSPFPWIEPLHPLYLSTPHVSIVTFLSSTTHFCSLSHPHLPHGSWRTASQRQVPLPCCWIPWQPANSGRTAWDHWSPSFLRWPQSPPPLCFLTPWPFCHGGGP